MSISIYGIITLVKVEVMCLFKELTGDTNSAMILLAELELKKNNSVFCLFFKDLLFELKSICVTLQCK